MINLIFFKVSIYLDSVLKNINQHSFCFTLNS